MVFLLLGGNELEGEIPASLMNLLGLASLSLNDNQLTGHIPLEISGLVNLETIDISNNQLTGEIPEGLSNPADLYYVNLSNNQLTGYITEQFCDMHFVDFSGNRFCAPYPECYSEEELGIQDTSSCGGLFSFPIEGR